MHKIGVFSPNAAAATTAATAAATAGHHASSAATASNSLSCRLLFSLRPPPSRLLVSSVVAPDPHNDNNETTPTSPDGAPAFLSRNPGGSGCYRPHRRRFPPLNADDYVATRRRRRLDLIVASLCAVAIVVINLTLMVAFHPFIVVTFNTLYCCFSFSSNILKHAWLMFL
jgi:hypothetical protein